MYIPNAHFMIPSITKHYETLRGIGAHPSFVAVPFIAGHVRKIQEKSILIISTLKQSPR